MNMFLRGKLSLVAQIVSQVCVNWTQLIHHRDSKRLKVSLLGLGNPWVSLEGFFLVIGKARIASPERVASPVLVLPLEVNLALLLKAFPSTEAKIASRLARNGALSLASRQRSLALNALSLALWQRFLAPGAVNESDAQQHC